MISLLLSIIIYLAASVILLWIAGAIYFDLGQATIAGGCLAILWLLAAAAILVLWLPPWKPFLLLLLVGCVFFGWWLSQRPSQDRLWNPSFALLPRIEIFGDTLTIENVRNAAYGTTNFITPTFETRVYRLSELCNVDVLIANWGSPWMCHPMIVFDFGPDGRVCFSIEVRYRVGQTYNFMRSIYRQQELMCVVCDERDAILRRTKDTPAQDVYLYRLQSDAHHRRRFLLEYANTINSLAERPRWYHGLTTNCTTSIYTQSRGRIRWYWKLLFNGKLDQLLYDLELLDQSMPFPQLKKQSRINDIANRARVEGFGETIRRELPGYQHSLDSDHQAIDAIRSPLT